MTDHAKANKRLEDAVAAQATVALKAELKGVAQATTGAFLRGTRGKALADQVGTMLERINPSAGPTLETAKDIGQRQGERQARQDAELDGTSFRTVDDQALESVILGSDSRIKNRLDEAASLATQLPMTDQEDVETVLAKAASSARLAETDAAWVVDRAVTLGHAGVALANNLNLVWIAERNACPACLAYQGHVVAPGETFPAGLTYGDRPIEPFGALIGPPLHPNCRCEVQTTDLEPGSLDAGLAREAARSIARGLTDYASDSGKMRAANRLLADPGALSLLPKSVVDRLRRNLAAGSFKARPGSPEARSEIARRTAARIARASR